MASTKYIVVSDCRFDGKHVAKGALLDLDMEDPKEAVKIALLNNSGRIGLATKSNIEAIQSEIQSEREQARQISQPRRAAMSGAAV